MPRSSETVAALASALAKAQAELVNPEKSLTATIRTGRAGDRERSFRYAPAATRRATPQSSLPRHALRMENARRSHKGGIPGTLNPDQSGALRGKLLTGLGNITSAGLAAAWARDAFTAKNSLSGADAKLVED